VVVLVEKKGVGVACVCLGLYGECCVVYPYGCWWAGVDASLDARVGDSEGLVDTQDLTTEKSLIQSGGTQAHAQKSLFGCRLRFFGRKRCECS
jgi:hypothetical protein